MTPDSGNIPNADQPDARAAPRADPTGELVDEIKGELANLADREIAARRRERELEHAYRRLHEQARHAVQEELVQMRARLEARSKALDDQTLELATRSDQFNQLEKSSSARERALEQKHQEFRDAARQLRQREKTLRTEREQAQHDLRQRAELIRVREVDLTKRIRAARDEIQGDRAELARQRDALRSQIAELEHRAQQVDAVRDESTQAFAETEAHATELARRKTDLQTQQTGLEQQHRQLAEAERAFEQQRAALQQRQSALDRQTHRTHAHRDELAHEREAIDAQRRMLEQQEAALQEQRQLIEHGEEQQRERAAELERTARDVQRREEELDALRESITPLREQALAAEQEATRHLDEVTALREQLDARDADSRQAALRVEVERQDLETERAAVARAHDELDQHRAQRAREAERIRGEFDRQAEHLRAAEHSLLAAPARWWLRSGALAALAAVPAFLGWLACEPPAFRSRAMLLIDSERTSPAVVVADHAAQILDPGRIADALSDPALTSAWTAALSAGRIDLFLNEQRPAVELTATDRDAAVARRLTRAAAETYRDLVNGVEREPPPPRYYADLTERQAAVQRELSEQRDRRDAAHAALRELATPPQRDALYQHVQQLQARYVQATQGLAAERRKLEALRTDEVPAGSLAPDQYAAALAADALYQEDLKELRATTLTYRSELAVGMVLVTAAVGELRAAIGTLTTTLTDQQKLEPPPAVRAVIEECQTRLSALDERTAQFAQTWTARRHAVERWQPDDDVVELVRQQNTAAEAAHELTEQTRTLVADLNTRIDALSQEGTVGTRGIVVGAVLRADLGHVAEQLAPFSEATDATDATKNFRLQTHDRQLRGVRTRLQQRRDTIVRRVDAEANRRARAAHDEQLAELERTVADLEQQREDLVLALAGKLDELHALDQQLVQRQTRAAELAQAESTVERLTTQLARLDEALERARRGGPRPDRIHQQIEIRSESIAGVHRYRNAALAAVGAFAATWLVTFVMILKNPLRRRESLLVGFETAASPDE